MGADLSRVRFDALRDHSGVIMQQGRLLLDADWNELMAIVDRRLRATAADLGSLGPGTTTASTAVVPRTTPGAFGVHPTSRGLTIGRGRMYVDGLLAENHGIDTPVFDPLLDGPARAEDTPYDQQPYWPTPDALPTSGTHLVYLSVWQREVTELQAPDLVEPAVGVSTTARTQTVWQVRVHDADTPGLTCETADADIPGWPEVTAPSGGRLTTGVVTEEEPEDPCGPPSAGGYRGPENQTYRLEIHDGGGVGSATFKWSRDNGSVAVPVAEVLAADRLRPAHLGHDTVLGLRTNDWVEILDDHREFAQRPGEMRRITVHDDGTVSFSPGLPDTLPADSAQAAARHLRIRRWDQSGRVRGADGGTLANLDTADSPGVITVPADGRAVVLEHGITVALEAPDGRFRSGDHWIFVARAQGARVDPPLTSAPPLGVHRHHARLAVVTFPGTATDCRTLWPPVPAGTGDCTLYVTPESHASGALTVQSAVDRTNPVGGTVCLAAGVYHLGAEPVRVTDAVALRLHGQGPRTVLVSSDNAVEVARSASVTLEDLAVVAGGTALRLESVAGVTARRLAVLVTGPANGGPPEAEPGAEPAAPPAAFELSGVAARVRIAGNEVLAPVGVRTAGASSAATLAADLEVSGNLLVCPVAGMVLERSAHLLRNAVRDNTVLRSGRVGLRAVSAPAPGAALEVSGNHALVAGTGIEVGPGDCTVRENTVAGTGEETPPAADGIAVVPGPAGVPRGAVRVTGNRVHDVTGAGVAVRAPVGDLEITRNTVTLTRSGVLMTDRARAATATVCDNTLTDLSGWPSATAEGVAGIQLVGAQRARVEGNSVSGVGTAPRAGARATGIRLLACRESRVSGNAVDRIGTPDSAVDPVGIHLAGFDRTLVEGNACRRDPQEAEEAARGPWHGLRVHDGSGRQEDAAPLGDYLAVPGAATHLLGRFAAFATTGGEGSAVVNANTVAGGGDAPAAEVSLAGDAVVTGNQLRQPTDSAGPALELTAGSATVHANRARQGRPSMRLNVDGQRLAVLGNVTSFGIEVPPDGLAPRWQELNVDGVR